MFTLGHEGVTIFISYSYFIVSTMIAFVICLIYRLWDIKRNND